jgi:hypothetical protein
LKKQLDNPIKIELIHEQNVGRETFRQHLSTNTKKYHPISIFGYGYGSKEGWEKNGEEE